MSTPGRKCRRGGNSDGKDKKGIITFILEYFSYAKLYFISSIILFIIICSVIITVIFDKPFRNAMLRSTLGIVGLFFSSLGLLTLTVSSIYKLMTYLIYTDKDKEEKFISKEKSFNKTIYFANLVYILLIVTSSVLVKVNMVNIDVKVNVSKN